MFQVGWRLAADIRFRPRIYYGVDDDLWSGSLIHPALHGHHVTRHHSDDWSASGAVQTMCSEGKEGKFPTEDGTKAVVLAGATQSFCASWASWCTLNVNGSCYSANRETRADFFPMASGGPLTRFVTPAVPSGGNRLTARMPAAPAVG